MLTMQCKAVGLPDPTPEFKFHPTRKWRVDFAWPEIKLAVEIDGGIWIPGKSGRGGAHSLPSNIIRDMEKNNELSILGWHLLRFTPGQVKNGGAISTIERYFNERRG
jgi:very-short-patch-repair endonuclease